MCVRAAQCNPLSRCANETYDRGSLQGGTVRWYPRWNQAMDYFSSEARKSFIVHPAAPARQPLVDKEWDAD